MEIYRHHNGKIYGIKIGRNFFDFRQWYIVKYKGWNHYASWWLSQSEVLKEAGMIEHFKPIPKWKTFLQ